MPATFFTPGYVAETHEDMVREIVRRGHETAHHGYMHEPPATLSRDEEIRVLDRGSDILERLTGRRPVGYRAPAAGAQRAHPGAAGPSAASRTTPA